MGSQWRSFRLVVLGVTVGLAVLGLLGCGSSTDSKDQPPPALDISARAEFPNGSLLIAPEALQASLGHPALVVVDARGSGYGDGHIPGAIHLGHGPFWDWGTGLKPVAELEQQLGAAGISRDATVVVYDDTTASFGAAGRIFWMLEYLGCTDVHILDGGWDKWAADGRPVQTSPVTLAPATFTAAVQGARKATTDRIAYRLFDRDFVVVDTRTDEEYLGWTLYGEARGGHIPGAVQIPYAWFYNPDKTVLAAADLQALFASRGVTPDKEVAAHCTVGIRSGFAYFLLRLLGYPRAANYDASIVAWADRADLPMETAPAYATVVHPAWVKALLDYHAAGSTSTAPPEYPYDRSHRYAIFETQWGSFEDMANGWADDSYLRGHIPGAFHSNSDTYENGFPRWFLKPDAELHAAVGAMGITADTTVVVYSNSPIFAARLWWILKYAGVADVRFLNGGFAAWQAAGYPVETAVNEPVATTFTGATRPAFLANTDDVLARYADPATTALVDVRTGSEYAGVISGYGYLANKGRIPNAIWAYDADDSSAVYHDADGTLRNPSEIRDLWADLGIGPDKESIFYCGGGYRSSLAFLYGYLLGWDQIRNYSDGWAGWSTAYTEDAAACTEATTITPPWCQDLSGRPVDTGWPIP